MSKLDIRTQISHLTKSYRVSQRTVYAPLFTLKLLNWWDLRKVSLLILILVSIPWNWGVNQLCRTIISWTIKPIKSWNVISKIQTKSCFLIIWNPDYSHFLTKTYWFNLNTIQTHKCNTSKPLQDTDYEKRYEFFVLWWNPKTKHDARKIPREIHHWIDTLCSHGYRE